MLITYGMPVLKCTEPRPSTDPTPTTSGGNGSVKGLVKGKRCHPEDETENSRVSEKWPMTTSMMKLIDKVTAILMRTEVSFL